LPEGSLILVKHLSKITAPPTADVPATTEPVTLLAVDPGARYMGVAFFVGGALIRAHVENVHKPGMDRKATIRRAENVIAGWIDDYQPAMIAIEQPHFAQARHSPSLNRIIKALTRLAARRAIGVRLYSPATVRRFVCRTGRPTRLAVARVIATERFPWLHPYYEKERQRSWWRKHYWTSMFDAIALGLTALERAKTRSARVGSPDDR
jgi:Holliday junction resolvasome RuvABC endonuclease subunit